MTPDDESHYYDSEIDDARRRLMPVFGLTEEEDFPPVKANYLEMIYDDIVNKISFPFQAEHAVHFQDSPEQEIRDIEIHEIIDPDNDEFPPGHGLWCKGFGNNPGGREPITLPLAEVVIKQDDPNYHWIEDYCIWFWEMNPGSGS